MPNRRTFLAASLAAACASTEHPPVQETSTDTIFELRNYTLHPGKRDVLIDLFEREFIEGQEAVGAHVVGTFRDLDAPDHFVWLRSFPDMEARPRALDAFYTGPVWRAHREAANATMIDSDDVHLLHIVGPPPRLPKGYPRPGAELSAAMFVIDAYALGDADARLFEAQAARDPHLVAMFATEQSPNNYPRLSVREDNVFVTLRRFAVVAEAPAIPGMPPSAQTLRLQPTACSRLH